MFKPSFVSKLSYGTFFIACAVFLAACSGDDKAPADEEGITPAERTYAIFSPVTSDLPVPNDLLFSSETAGDGTMTAGSDPGNPVIEGIDALDGASVLAPVDVRFSGSLQANQNLDAVSFITAGSSVIPNPSQNVFLLPLSFPGGDALLQARVNGQSVEVPTFAKAVQYQRAVAQAQAGNPAALIALATPDARAEIISLDGGTNNTLRIYPLRPLMPETKYLVAVTTLLDANGNDVLPALAYDYISDPNTNITASPSLPALRAAIQSWEQLASGYFGFMQTVFNSAGVGTAPTRDDLIFTMTFTTTGTQSVLKSIAAPETFFEKSLTTGYRQAAISKLVSGTYNVNGNNSSLTDPVDIAINTTINVLLTSPQLPGPTPNPLYNATIAGAIGAGAGYATIAADASAAHIMQVAAGEAALSVHNGDGVTIATEAIGTVSAMAAGVSAPVPALFPVPAPRSTNFYRVDLASQINPALTAPAYVYRGDITLPYFLAAPEGTDGSAITGESWTANQTIGAVIDVGRGNDPGTTPPSDMITYRYPFPTKRSDQVVPIHVTMPASDLIGVSKPANGWPVVIFVHGITSDRSTSLPMSLGLATACVAAPPAPCFATISIDQPLHGFTPSTKPLEGDQLPDGSAVPGFLSVNDPDYLAEPNVGSNTPTAGLTERHFNFTADAAQNAVPMNYDNNVGESGSLFINLANFTNSRDILRQMTIDLLNVSASIDSMDVNGDGTPDDLDPNNVYVIGHSLGGINGIPFIALNNDAKVQASPFSTLPPVKAATLMLTGSAPPTLLINSMAFSDTILGGLAAASPELTVGRSGLETYLAVFQGLLDSVDPIHFAPSLTDANSSTGILMTELIGNGASVPSDLVIPNGADPLWGLSPMVGFNAPFAGTEPLAYEFGAVDTADATSDGDPAVIITRFIEGSHRTPVVGGNTAADPLTTQASFNELMAQVITFFALDGDVPGSIIINPDVVEP